MSLIKYSACGEGGNGPEIFCGLSAAQPGFQREAQMLSETNLDVFSGFGKDGLERVFEGRAFSRHEIGGA